VNLKLATFTFKSVIYTVYPIYTPNPNRNRKRTNLWFADFAPFLRNEWRLVGWDGMLPVPSCQHGFLNFLFINRNPWLPTPRSRHSSPRFTCGMRIEHLCVPAFGVFSRPYFSMVLRSRLCYSVASVVSSLCRMSVCLSVPWGLYGMYVFWLNGTSYSKSYYWQPIGSRIRYEKSIGAKFMTLTFV